MFISSQAVDQEDPCLNIDGRDLYTWDKTLYAQLIDYPGEVIPLFDIETSALASGWSGRDLEGAIRVRARADSGSSRRSDDSMPQSHLYAPQRLQMLAHIRPCMQRRLAITMPECITFAGVTACTLSAPHCNHDCAWH